VNYCNELALKILQRKHAFAPPMTCTATPPAHEGGLSLHSQTVQAIRRRTGDAPAASSRARLAWRRRRRAPLTGLDSVKASALRYKNGQVWYGAEHGRCGTLWLALVRTGHRQLQRDSRGRWYLNVTVKLKRPARSTTSRCVGIDLD